MKSSSHVVVVSASEALAASSVGSIDQGSEWLVCQEEMRRVRVARRVLGRERRDDVGVVLLLLVVEEEVRRVRVCGLGMWSLVESSVWPGSVLVC